MNTYLRNLIVYFENVLHPASGWSEHGSDKRKRKGKKMQAELNSPESFNLRGVLKKQDKQRLSPAP